jgi:hypothetical protein
MALFDRLRHRSRKGDPTAIVGRGGMEPEAEAHLRQFVATRRGVEGFVEPRTTVSDVTLLLVATDGEWTRRRVPSVAWAHEFANGLGVPSYDAALVGIPSRMREYNRRQKHPKIEDDPTALDG